MFWAGLAAKAFVLVKKAWLWIALAAAIIGGALWMLGRAETRGQRKERNRQLKRENEARRRMMDADVPRTPDDIEKELNNGTF